jgi:hypothetical protein
VSILIQCGSLKLVPLTRSNAKLFSIKADYEIILQVEFSF